MIYCRTITHPENANGRWEGRAREALSENFSQLCFADCASVSIHLMKAVESLCVAVVCSFSVLPSVLL